MKTIRFTETRRVNAGTPDEEVFEEGSKHTLEDASAERWLRRGAAELVKPEGEGAGAESDEGGEEDKTRLPSDGLTVAQIKEALAEREIEIPEGVTLKADLAKLLDDAPAA